MQTKLNLNEKITNWGKKLLSRRYLLTLGGVGALLGAFSKASANVPHVFTNGQLTDANQINENFNVVVDIAVPVGGIIPWHKTLVNPITLSDRWIECNGQTVNDSTSPLYGQTVPDLNGEARFLRGNSESGIMQDDTLQEHAHRYYMFGNTASNADYPPRGTNGGNLSNQPTGGVMQSDWTGQHNNVGHLQAARASNETRPKNMSVVWIMRVK